MNTVKWNLYRIVLFGFWELNLFQHCSRLTIAADYFCVAMLVRVHIEHELSDRALQPRRPSSARKTRTAQLRRDLEIHKAERSAEVVVRFRRKKA